MKGKNDKLGLADPVMLDKIDKLFACNVGHYIDLPQLVVVGNQSSGKSSVLEGLTNLPFPKDSGLCTRFATQITFKREKETRITVSVIPAKDVSKAHANKCRGWKKTLTELDQASFAAIMREVHMPTVYSQNSLTNLSLPGQRCYGYFGYLGPTQDFLRGCSAAGSLRSGSGALERH